MEIKGGAYRPASDFAYAPNKSNPTMQVSEDKLGSGEKVMVARTDIVDIWKAANPEPRPIVEGYAPPDVSLEPFMEGRKIFCDIGNFAEEYMPPNTSGLSEGARFVEEVNDIFSRYANIVSAYDKVFSICDEDIAFCAKLVEENTEPEHTAPLAKMLEDAKTRRKNIGEQAADDLSSRTRFIKESMSLWIKAEKILGNADEIVESIEEGFLKNIFAKLDKFDFSQLSKGYDESLFAISQLKDMFSEWY